MKKKLQIITISIILLTIASSCSDGIVSECETPSDQIETAIEPTLSDIQEKIFTPTCATSGCHDAAGAQFLFGLNLEEGNSYLSLVGKETNSSNKPYVDPGDAENSFLVDKIRGDNTSIMPPSTSGQPLNEAEINAIVEWINNGALDN